MTESPTITLIAHLHLTGVELEGELTGPDGRRIPFSGWLGLIGAVESAAQAAADARTHERLMEDPR